MRDVNDPDTIAFLKSQNSKCEASLKNLEPLRERVYNEIKSRIVETDISIPSRSDDYWYYSRSVEGKNYSINCRIKVNDKDNWTPPKLYDETIPAGLPPKIIIPENEEVIFDHNLQSELLGSDFYSSGGVTLSVDYSKLLYQYDIVGDERYELRIRDYSAWLKAKDKTLASKFDLPDVLCGICPGASFDLNGEYVFYTKFDDSWRPYQLWRHKVGEKDQKNDVLIYQEDDREFTVSFGVTGTKYDLPEHRFYAIYVSSKNSDEMWLLRCDDPTGEFSCFRAREANVEYSVGFYPEYNYYFLIHNCDNVDFDIDLYKYSPVDFKSGKKIGRFLSSNDNSEQFVRPIDEKRAESAASLNTNSPKYSDRQLAGVACYKNFIICGFTEDLQGRAFVLKIADFLNDPLNPAKYWREILPNIDIGDAPYAISAGADDYNSPVIKWSYHSYTSPSKLFLRDLRALDFCDILLKQQIVLDDPDGVAFDETKYQSRRLFATAIDGEEVPISLVWKGDSTHLPQNAPCLLYSYGAYGSSQGVSFSIPRLSLMDRGIVMAFAHIRGGSEKGQNWYYDGRMQNKIHTFTDFIDVAKHLIAQNITSSDKLVANGGSAGGLLVGAVLNMSPELFCGIGADVPFVDPLTSILMPDLPLTTQEWQEWGNPIESKEVYEYMKSYSPYENIKPATNFAKTPKIFVTTSLNDTRVLFTEPAKWTAKLLENGYDVLLKTELEAGHGGVSGRYNAMREIAYSDAWIIKILQYN